MISFKVSRLFDEPLLECCDFVPEGRNQWDEVYCLTIYVVRTDSEVLYVGKSDADCFTRLRTHIGHPFRGRPSNKSPLGRWIETHLPESRNWTVEMYTNEETKSIIPPKFWEGFVNWPTDYAESGMIVTLKPLLNRTLNARRQR